MNAISHDEIDRAAAGAISGRAGAADSAAPVSLVGSGQLDIEAAVLGRLKPAPCS